MEPYLPLDENPACAVTHTTSLIKVLVAEYIFEGRVWLQCSLIENFHLFDIFFLSFFHVFYLFQSKSVFFLLS